MFIFIVNKASYLIIILLFNFNLFANDYIKWIKETKSDAMKAGISEDTYNRATSILSVPNKKVLKYYKNQPEFTISFDDYYKRNINKKRINSGKKLMNKHKKLLKSISAEYFVPPEIIVSIWGIETNYGSYIGTFNIIDALSTLAYASQRKSFFKKEFFNSLLILEKNYVKQEKLIGSWAGAMGQSQFMPSSFLNFAVDYNNDKKIDLWNDYDDIFSSIANYLHKHGWKKDNNWSNEIFLKKKYINNFNPKKKYTKKTINEIIINNEITYNIKSTDKIDIKTIIKNPYKRYFLIFDNYNVIKKYNNSDFYALIVSDLANKIKE